MTSKTNSKKHTSTKDIVDLTRMGHQNPTPGTTMTRGAILNKDTLQAL